MTARNLFSRKTKVRLTVTVAVLLIAKLSPWIYLVVTKSESEPFIVPFYTAASEDAAALNKLLIDGHELILKAGIAGPQGVDSRVKLKVFYQKLITLEASLYNEFATKLPAQNGYIENSLQAEYAAVQKAAWTYRSMLKAILALDAIEESASQEGNLYPLQSYEYSKRRDEYQFSLLALRGTMSDGNMDYAKRKFD